MTQQRIINFVFLFQDKYLSKTPTFGDNTGLKSFVIVHAIFSFHIEAAGSWLAEESPPFYHLSEFIKMIYMIQIMII